MFKKKNIICLLLALIMMLSGCGKGETNAPVTDSGQKTTAKDSIVFSINADIQSLDTNNIADTVSYMVAFQVYDTLIRQEPDDSLAPGLAESWQISEDGKEITFKLKDGVKFHNGDSLTAADVAYSVNRAIGSTYAQNVTSIMESAEVVDDSNVKVILKEAYAPILYCFTNGNMGIVSQKAVEAAGEDYARNPVGTGPYKFVEWKSGEKIVLERFEDYFRGPAPIKNLTFMIMSDKNTAAIALEKGEVDVLYDPDMNDIENLKNTESIQYLQRPLSNNFYFIAFNTKEGIFSNQKLREAVSYAINRDDIVEGALNGLGSPVEGPIGLNCFGHQENFKNNPYDPDKAKELLTEAGYPDGLTVTMKLNQSSYYTKPAEVVQEQLRKVGINVEMDLLERGAFLEDVADNCRYDVTLYMVSYVIPDADYTCYTRFHSDNIGYAKTNYTQYNNPQIDDLIMKARYSQDNDERYEIYGQICEIIRKDAPMIPLMTSISHIAAGKDLKGVYASPGQKHYVFNYSW